MTVHHSDIHDDITVEYLLHDLNADAFHITLRPLILELSALPGSAHAPFLLCQLRSALVTLYGNERRTAHHWDHRCSLAQRRLLEIERWTTIERLDALLDSGIANRGIREDEIIQYLTELGKSEHRKLALGRTFESIGTGAPSNELQLPVLVQ